MVSKRKKIGGISLVLILLGIYTVLNLFNKAINAVYVAQNGFQMISYHPWTFWISLIGGALWIFTVRYAGRRWRWTIVGWLGIAYAIFMLLGGALHGWFI
jgi:hypothetical protein